MLSIQLPEHYCSNREHGHNSEIVECWNRCRKLHTLGMDKFNFGLKNYRQSQTGKMCLPWFRCSLKRLPSIRKHDEFLKANNNVPIWNANIIPFLKVQQLRTFWIVINWSTYIFWKTNGKSSFKLHQKLSTWKRVID